MEDRLIAYFDILGFSEVVKRGDPSVEELIMSVLESFAHAVGDSSSKDVEGPPGHHRITVQPSVSAFSDHIVYSYPLPHITNHIPFLAFQALAQIVASMVFDTMKFGCLVRGAITTGPLHHRGGIIFGPGLIDAYWIESKLAVYPRIIVSQHAAELTVRSEATSRNPVLFKDRDGLWCLDYLSEAFDGAGAGVSTLELPKKLKVWREGFLATCDAEIARLATGNNIVGLKYWRWFRAYFDETFSRRGKMIVNWAANHRD